MMDIRTLLTESKPFLPKRKVDSILQDSPSTSSHGAQMSESIKSDINTSVAQSSSASMPKKVKFTLNEATSAPGPRSFTLTISPTDPPSAITATVKDFFALHNCGVSFTDQRGCILIITPDNLTDDMDVIVNQTSIADNGEKGNKKRRKTSLSSRKRTTTREVAVGREIMEEEGEEDDDDEGGIGEESSSEKRERVFSSDVSIENILDSSRRRLSKFSSENLPLTLSNLPTPPPPSSSPRKIPRMTLNPPRDTPFPPPLPTPTPTTASVISDEDVAIQLMRLTDPLATPILTPSVIDSENDIPPSTTAKAPDEHSRCTRCIASKKGCDRKRPCGRCEQQGFKDADCMSDDEGGSARKKVAALRRIGRGSVGRVRKVTK